jgi:hypothetical protein
MHAIFTKIAYHGQVESKHRRHTRVEAKVAGHVRGGESSGAAEIDNISLGGLFMRTNAPLPVGLALTIELKSATDALTLSGKVVSASGDGVGIAFDVLPGETERRLKGVLDELEKSPNAASWTAIAAPNDANVRGLLEMLSDALGKLKERDREVAELRAELRLLKK